LALQPAKIGTKQAVELQKKQGEVTNVLKAKGNDLITSFTNIPNKQYFCNLTN